MPNPSIVTHAEVSDCRAGAAVIELMAGTRPQNILRSAFADRWEVRFAGNVNWGGTGTRTQWAGIQTDAGPVIVMEGAGSGAGGYGLHRSYVDLTVRESGIGANRLMLADAQTIIAAMQHFGGWGGVPTLIGHSYGGGTMAVLAGVLLERNIVSRVKVYSFGSPCPGDARLAETLAGQRVVRFMNQDDAVPYLPPKAEHFPELRNPAVNVGLILYYGIPPDFLAYPFESRQGVGFRSLQWVQPGMGVNLDPAGNVSERPLPLLSYENIRQELEEAAGQNPLSNIGGPDQQLIRDTPGGSYYAFSPQMRNMRYTRPGTRRNVAYTAHIINEYLRRLTLLQGQYGPAAPIQYPSQAEPITTVDPTPAMLPARFPLQASTFAREERAATLERLEVQVMALPVRFRARVEGIGLGEFACMWMGELIASGTKRSPLNTLARRINSMLPRMQRVEHMVSYPLTTALANFIAQTGANPPDVVPPIPWD